MAVLVRGRFDLHALYQVTLPFLEYVKTRGFMIEVFGHYEQHPLHFESDTVPPVKSPTPFRPGLTVPYQKVSSAQPVAKYDVIMNLQICEQNPQGDYIPVPVTHVRKTNGSFFLLQQALQKRLVLSFVYDSTIELKMKKVSALVREHSTYSGQNKYLWVTSQIVIE